MVFSPALLAIGDLDLEWEEARGIINDILRPRRRDSLSYKQRETPWDVKYQVVPAESQPAPKSRKEKFLKLITLT
jgi:hypothetical protein